MRSKFTDETQIGPVWAAQVAAEHGENAEFVRRDAFECAVVLLDALGVARAQHGQVENCRHAALPTDDGAGDRLSDWVNDPGLPFGPGEPFFQRLPFFSADPLALVQIGGVFFNVIHHLSILLQRGCRSVQRPDSGLFFLLGRCRSYCCRCCAKAASRRDLA